EKYSLPTGFSQSTCQVRFGLDGRCRKIFILTNKTTYILGGLWSTIGIVEERDYGWTISGVGYSRAFSGPRIEVVFVNTGNYTLDLVVNDSLGREYAASHDFEVLEFPIDEVELVDNRTMVSEGARIAASAWDRFRAWLPTIPKRALDWGIENKWFLGTATLVGLVGAIFVYSQRGGFIG
ncbi:MAG: hypothetical protein V3U02_00140, partial [Calditrichia bacterium]